MTFPNSKHNTILPEKIPKRWSDSYLLEYTLAALKIILGKNM
jgi:hypothetical protein